MSHTFGLQRLAPFEETQPRVAWTLQNEAPLYVERVQLRNGGSFHHSNWFVVPEDLYEGPDGYFDCDERRFDELGSAAAGTVIFAQSTRSVYEEQRLGQGVVIKVPPRHRLVAGTHLLNLSDQEVETELRVTLEVMHPAKVKTVVAPFRLTYHDLHIPPRAELRFLAECDVSADPLSRPGSHRST